MRQTAGDETGYRAREDGDALRYGHASKIDISLFGASPAVQVRMN